MAKSLLNTHSILSSLALVAPVRVSKVTFESNGDQQLEINVPAHADIEVADRALEMIEAKAKELGFRGTMRLREWEDRKERPWLTIIVPKGDSTFVERVVRATPVAATK